MAYTNKTGWLSDVDRDINTNGQQRITGAVMNARLHDLADSILWGDWRKVKGTSVSSKGTLINFSSPMRNTQYKLFVRVFNASGESVGYTIDPAQQTVSGFHILPAVDGSMDYVTIE